MAPVSMYEERRSELKRLWMLNDSRLTFFLIFGHGGMAVS